MHQCYERCAPFKWQILSSAVRKQHELMWLGGTSRAPLAGIAWEESEEESGGAQQQQQQQMVLVEPDEAGEERVRVSVNVNHSSGAKAATASAVAAPSAVSAPPTASSGGVGLSEVKLQITPPQGRMPDVRLAIPGRIFHLTETTPKASTVFVSILLSTPHH